jgi:hypothetical protein
MIRFRHACVLVGTLCLTFLGCAGRSRWPRLAHGAQYEVHNPTFCRAQVYTATENNVTRQYLGQVPSGGRAVVTVPPRSEGTRVVAMSLYPDGTNCEVGARIRIRRVGP